MNWLHSAAGDSVIPLLCAQCGECAMCKREGTNLCLAYMDTKVRKKGCRLASNALFFVFLLQKRGLMADGASRMTCKGQAVHSFTGCSTFSEYFVAYEEAVAKVRLFTAPSPFFQTSS